MRHFFYTLLAVMMAACSAPAFAQEYVTDYKSIKVNEDFVLDNGTRMISATPFLVYESEKVRATAYVFVFIPKGRTRDTDSWQWLLVPQMSYRSRTGLYAGVDTSAQFCKDDVLILMEGLGGPEYEMGCIGSLTDRTGSGLVCGAFLFDDDAVHNFLKGHVPDRMFYTQGGRESGVFPALEFKSAGSFAFPFIMSGNVILDRVLETLE